MILKKILLCYSAIPFLLSAQPDQWYVAIDPSEVPTLLGPSRRTIDMVRVNVSNSPQIDGEKDAVWNNITPVPYDRFITYHTQYKNNTYSRVSDLSDGTNSYRLPDNHGDFSGNFRLLYDDDYLYAFLDITDNEVNDNFINPGIKESFELQEAIYPDSAQQALQGKTYPPYSGLAPEINKKFCYWGYLGAFKFWFFLAQDGKCTSEIREKPEAVKINYSQRLQSCQCAWKYKEDGSGYTAEIALNFKVALADSSGNPYKLPATDKDTQWISFEMKCYDEDQGMKPIQASWNAQDDNVWDAMVYSGKLLMKGWTLGSEYISSDEIIIYPNPASEKIFLNRKAETARIISSEGIIMGIYTNINHITISELIPGLYILITDTITFPFIKQ